jgi:hypothetical protein
MNKGYIFLIVLFGAIVLVVWPPHRREDPRDWWRTPIDFYGKVVDESSNTIAGADVHFVWTDLSPTGNSEKQATSDSDGLFSLRGVSGLNLIVTVSKQGYHAYQPFGAAFNYAGEAQNFTPDAANPIVFRLKKKGVAERLIRFTKGFDVSRNGTPVEVSLTSAQSVPSGQGDLRVECWTADQGRKPGQDYDWKCRITVPGGGLSQRTDNLDFGAPLDGYTPSDEIDMPATLGNQWTMDVKRNYFLRLASGKYARVSFEMIAGGEHFFRLESFLNPSGSTNLEYDPENYIHAGQ